MDISRGKVKAKLVEAKGSLHFTRIESILYDLMIIATTVPTSRTG